ncbi:pyridoxamine 5'-phosphate oxidase family protein [Streptomyces sp. TRM 70351]|uniref:pyridoxamine 5'-phosphate oxidase family protein n=1 Tax=Streptomyces sp. TRM 70351 TaxID=3116552 RepID=UPI002E7AB639|nr:pyridoxamine 5'-phosphate oxidase family protein [Streptomyces sp. TRM 70351]MEE1929988.1 pyridoxamine 5'-phosphate oxidase family protein [Streptomyces sp. TRM 70351]
METGDVGRRDGTRPGGPGEHAIQERLGSTARADRFYDEQMLDRLNDRMRDFVAQQEMFFLATSDGSGECDSTFRAGPRGFLRVLDERTLAFPEYRGNGVHASLGNIRENPHLGILLVDFVRARIGLHVNGSAEILEDAEIRAEHPDLPEDAVPGRRPELWVRVTVEEAYIHCAKHIPHLQYAPKRTAREWGTDDHKRKGGDFFGAARDRTGRGAAPAPLPKPASPEPARPEPARLEPARLEPARPEPVRPEPVSPEPASPEPVSPEPVGTAEPGVAAEPAAERPGRPGRVPVPVARHELLPARVPSATAWREEAERVLAEAQARSRDTESEFQGWFG